MSASGESRQEVRALYRDCRDLARYISDARREIARIRPTNLREEKIPRAGLELDAIVQATESATNTIMEAAETILAAGVESTAVDDACMQIFEACSFQDITGQRITKVVKTLQHIESRLDTLQQAWGPDLGFAEAEADPDDDEEKALLNGPQLDGHGVSQADIDSMMDADEPAPGPAEPNPKNAQDAIDALFD